MELCFDLRAKLDLWSTKQFSNFLFNMDSLLASLILISNLQRQQLETGGSPAKKSDKSEDNCPTKVSPDEEKVLVEELLESIFSRNFTVLDGMSDLLLSVSEKFSNRKWPISLSDVFLRWAIKDRRKFYIILICAKWCGILHLRIYLNTVGAQLLNTFRFQMAGVCSDFEWCLDLKWLSTWQPLKKLMASLKCFIDKEILCLYNWSEHRFNNRLYSDPYSLPKTESRHRHARSCSGTPWMYFTWPEPNFSIA